MPSSYAVDYKTLKAPSDCSAAEAQAALRIEAPPNRIYSNIFVSICLEIGLDLLSIVSGATLGYIIWRLPDKNLVSHELLTHVLRFSLQYGVFFILLMRSYHGYDQIYSLLNVRETERILRSSFNSLILYWVNLCFTRDTLPSILLGFSWLSITFLVLAQRHASASWFAHWKAESAPKQRTLIYGTGKDARRLYSALLKSPHLGLLPVAFVDEDRIGNERVLFSHGYKHTHHAPVFPRKLTPDLFRELNIQLFAIAEPSASAQRMADIVALAGAHSIAVSYLGTTQYHAHDRPVCIRSVDGLLLTSYTKSEIESIIYPVSKRLLDVVISSLLLCLTLPLWLIIAACIKAGSPGPVFFRQQRIGRYGVSFDLLKFRSMYVDAPRFAKSPRDSSDLRITKPGRFLRRSSLDELPQLLNVLAGSMSLVGPRPEMPYIVARYNSMERQRLTVKQGLTGIWQLSADRKYAIHEALEHDLYYIENRSLCLDVAVLIHTALFAAQGI